MSAFDDAVKSAISEAFKHASESMHAEHFGLPLPKLAPREKQPMLEYVALEDFTYEHIDHDVNRGVYSFSKGQTIHLDEHSQMLPDKSKLKFVGKVMV